MSRAVIIDAVRSPMGRGKAGGALSGVHPVDLLAQVLQALVARNDLDPGTVDDVLVGCVGGNGEQSATPGRQAVLAAGWPEHVPSVTIERKCGSGQQALDFAVQGIAAGAYDVAVAAGVESMSRVPMGSARGRGRPARAPRRGPVQPGPGSAGRLGRAGRRQVGTHPGASSTSTPHAPTNAPRTPPPRGHSTARSCRSRPPTAPWRQTRRSDRAPRRRSSANSNPRSAPGRTRPASPTWTGRSPPATPPRSPTAPRRCWS